jgi:hypothetical protein
VHKKASESDNRLFHAAEAGHQLPLVGSSEDRWTSYALPLVESPNIGGSIDDYQDRMRREVDDAKFRWRLENQATEELSIYARGRSHKP